MNNTPYYKDPSVKAAGVVENYSQEQVQEYIRCSQDPTYFIEKYIQVNTIDKGLVPLNLRPYQKILLNLFIIIDIVLFYLVDNQVKQLLFLVIFCGMFSLMQTKL